MIQKNIISKMFSNQAILMVKFDWTDLIVPLNQSKYLHRK